MKKILIVLFSLLLLVGCQTKGYSKLSNGDEVIFKGPNITYTKNDLYKSLKLISDVSVENDILAKIAEKINIDTSDIEKEADEMIDLYKTMGYESIIISYYGSIESYREMYIKSGVVAKLAETYINENFETLIDEDAPVKMQFATFDNTDSANQLIEKVNNGSTFESAAAELGYGECSVKVYLDSNTILPLEVKSYLNETNTNGLSSIVTVTNTTSDADGNINVKDTYYVLNIVSRNANDFVEDYINAKLEVLDETVVKEYMLSKYNIEFYDQDIYEIMSSKYEVLK